MCCLLLDELKSHVAASRISRVCDQPSPSVLLLPVPCVLSMLSKRTLIYCVCFHMYLEFRNMENMQKPSHLLDGYFEFHQSPHMDKLRCQEWSICILRWIVGDRELNHRCYKHLLYLSCLTNLKSMGVYYRLRSKSNIFFLILSTRETFYTTSII